MALPRFDFKNAQSFMEAAEAIKAGKEKAVVISGGTDLLHGFKDHIYKEYPDTVINLRSIPDAEGLEETDTGVKIGALTTLHELEGSSVLKSRYAALAQAAYQVASPQIRNNSTIGGNICQQPRCWYYRNADGLFDCLRKGGSFCNAQTGRNEIHSIFGSVKVKETPCQEGCPAGNAIPEYFAKLRAGDEKSAAEILIRTNPLAAITGRVCPHTCTDDCNRVNVDEAVSIRSVERTVGDYMLAHAGELTALAEDETGHKVAIVGSGPAGLSAAFFLRMQGHQVTILEQMEKAGGMLRYGIPSYRLPDAVLDEQIRMLEEMGIEIRTGTAVGQDVKLEDLRDAYEAVFLASGAWSPVSIGLEGEEYTVPAMEMLKEIAQGSRVCPGKEVIVVGGGNVAVDAAMSAKRLGAEKVTMICLESREEMPAFEDDINDALEEGVEIRTCLGPDKVLVEDGKVTGLKTIRCTSVRDEQGRFAPSYDPSVSETFTADSVILAVGQKTDLSYIDQNLGITGRVITADEVTQETPVSGLYAGGDAVSGPASVVKAMAAGRRAAQAINIRFGKSAVNEPDLFANELACFDPTCLSSSSPCRMAKRPQNERSIENEDACGLTAGQTISEAVRCFNCGCVAASPSDLAPALIALDAVIVTTERMIDAKDFFAVRVQSSTVLRDGELVTEIRLPQPDPDTRSTYLKFRQRKSIDFPLVSTAVSVTCKDRIVSDARIVLGAVAPVPLRAVEAEKYLEGKELNEETAAEAGRIALKDAQPLMENAYKIQVAKAYVRRALLALHKEEE